MARLDSICYKNDICQQCIKRNFEKYGKFAVNCEGIDHEKTIKMAMKHGFDEKEARYAYDPAFFFQENYNSKPRDYQYKILRCSAKNLALRQCRQTGKTLMIIYKILHFVMSEENKTVLIIAPQEKQVYKIWDEYIFRDGILKNDRLKNSVTDKRQKPYYEVKFNNGSKIVLMIAGPGARSQTADWLYIDEAAMIPTETLNDIIMTIGSKSNPRIFTSSTPKGRGSFFYKACKEDNEFNEFHVSIHDVEEMASNITKFKRILGETGFIQECEAEFPDSAGGPFNMRGVTLAKKDYFYENCFPEQHKLYFGGVDWNGPGIGTYFYVVSFDTSTLEIKVVDKEVVSSANWNSTVAKKTLLELNRKWKPVNWMCDAGYGHSIIEDLSLYSLKVDLPKGHPDKMLKHILEPIEFGKWMEIEDPFTREQSKKTTKSFIISQFSRLFEIPEGLSTVPFAFSKNDEDLCKSFDLFKLLQITDSGIEKYGFDKKDGIEDHAIDALTLAIYGIVKNYSELFKRSLYESRSISNENILGPRQLDNDKKVFLGSSIVLLTDNSPEPIELDEKVFTKKEKSDIIITRSFSRNGAVRSGTSMVSAHRNRGIVIRRSH